MLRPFPGPRSSRFERLKRFQHLFNECWRYSVRSARFATRSDRYSVYVSPSTSLTRLDRLSAFVSSSTSLLRSPRDHAAASGISRRHA
eukprot:2523619-Alexandrium_andersonii.AAC.1